MGKNSALTKRLEPDSGHESLSSVSVAFNLKLLLINVEAPSRILPENAVSLPIVQKTGRTRVSIGGIIVAGFFFIENESNDVVRASSIERLLQLRTDDVIGRDR